MTLARGRVVRSRPSEAAPPPGVVPRPESAPQPGGDLATVAALAMKIRAREARADEQSLDRVVELARMLAERLLAKSLELAPETVIDLARGVLAEAPAARRVELFVHPAHVSVLDKATASFDPERRVHAIRADSSLGIGDVRLETEFGSVDARLGTSLDQLAERLSVALRS